MVAMVVTISPSFSLYRIVVFPAASRPTMRMRISFLPKRPLKRFAKIFPMLVDRWKQYWPETSAAAAPSQALVSLPPDFLFLRVFSEHHHFTHKVWH